MIIWLASYPKSGNTLVRSMLSAYFFSKEGIFNQHLIKNIKIFPNVDIFENFGVNIKNKDEVIKNYIKVQNSFNKKNSIQFLKTHSYLFNFYNKYPFTDLNNSLGAIYIVRDPRNVVTSYAKFLSSSIDVISKIMINKLYTLSDLNSARNKDERIITYTGTWSSNFESWKSFKLKDRYLLIKYEDLITDPEKNFLKILEFIHRLKKVNFVLNKNKFKKMLETTTFDYMSNLEKKEGFIEAKINPQNKKVIPFFNLGPKNDWRKLLDTKVKVNLEKAFEKEMIELGYL